MSLWKDLSESGCFFSRAGIKGENERFTVVASRVNTGGILRYKMLASRHCSMHPCVRSFSKITRSSRASAILAKSSCAAEDK